MKIKSYILPSFAKINLFLHIQGKRSDGFHEICTVFQTVSLHDKLEFKESDKLELVCDNKRIPTDESNLIIKSANLLRQKTGSTQGAKILLEKNIPFPGGLGGGSSNAAVTLLGLSELWNLKISFDELSEVAAEIGSDVPFFLQGGTAIGTGRGTEIEVLQDYTENNIIIITPNIEIPTSAAYKEVNAEDLTKIDAKSILKICRDKAERLASGHLNFQNDFEKTVFEIEPELRRLKNKLLSSGATNALLSGSGASVFAIFDNEEKRQIALSAFESEENIRKFAVKTVSRQEYRNYLKPCRSFIPKSL